MQTQCLPTIDRPSCQVHLQRPPPRRSFKGRRLQPKALAQLDWVRVLMGQVHPVTALSALRVMVLSKFTVLPALTPPHWH